MKKNILIIGGTGLVGKLIVQMLKEQTPNQELYIGSRKENLKNNNFLKIDVTNPASFKIISQKFIHLVVLCASDGQNNVLNYCIENGIDYIDITKPTPELSEAYFLAKSKKLNSQIVFSSGWMGGIVGSMAFYLEREFDSVQLFISYSLNDLAGESTTHFIAENVTKTFETYIDNKPIETKHFLRPYKNNFAFGVGLKNAYDFDIPELFIFHEVEKIPTVGVKMTYNSDIISSLLYYLQRLRIFDIITYSMKKAMFNSSGNGDRIIFEVLVKKGNIQKKISLIDTEGQSHLTAFSTVMHIKKMLYSNHKGLFFSHQLHNHSDVIQELRKQTQVKLEIKDIT